MGVNCDGDLIMTRKALSLFEQTKKLYIALVSYVGGLLTIGRCHSGQLCQVLYPANWVQSSVGVEFSQTTKATLAYYQSHYQKKWYEFLRVKHTRS